MLIEIKEFDVHGMIVGFRNPIIKDLEEMVKTVRKEADPNVEIQFFDAQLVATWQHLYFAVLDALTVFANRDNIAKDLAMEIMLYASAQRQIRKATELVGISRASSRIAVLVIGTTVGIVQSALAEILKHIDGQRDDTVLELSPEKVQIIKKAFGISEIELETVLKTDKLNSTLTDLVIERMALLMTQR